MITQEIYIEQIQQELEQTPAEYLPALLNIIHSYRESICRKPFGNLQTFQAPSNNFSQQKTLDDLFGLLTAEISVSIEDMEKTISLKAQERFNDCN
ncbi:MAG: hypothetical protein HQK72_15625 [Desulfamplus sp.]|nr:hypothetical protein [Desulfamplus sp.]